MSIGVYGVISYTVERQTQEIGIRLALGAQRQGILQRVVGEASALAVVGMVVGTVGGLAVSRTMSSVLYGVPSNDPVTFAFASVSALVAVVALLASYIPARRAAKIDPMAALRYE